MSHREGRRGDGPDARRLLYFDLETTGTDPESDRIVPIDGKPKKRPAGRVR